MPSELMVRVLSNAEDRRFFELCEPFKLLGYTVPTGYKTDFASVPRFFWRLYPPTGVYMHAAVLHDWLCDTKILGYKETHLMFDMAMTATGVPDRTRKPMAWAVKRFGPRW